MDNKFSSRKFLLTVLSLIFAGVALLMDKLTSIEFITLLPIILGSYLTANVIESNNTQVNANIAKSTDEQPET